VPTSASSSAPPATDALQSRLIEWDARRGFGYVDHGGKRLFLHHLDLLDRGHRPRKGDVLSYRVGTDEKGRSCAKAARFRRTRGLLRFRDLVGLLLLLLLPALAMMRLPWPAWMTATYVAVVSLICYWHYRDDKRRALDGERRIPENTLNFLELIGGWPGAFLAQRQFHHKTAKAAYQFVFRSIVLVYQALSLDYLLGWAGSRWISEFLRGL